MYAENSYLHHSNFIGDEAIANNDVTLFDVQAFLSYSSSN